MITYERVTFKPEGSKRARTIYLEDPTVVGGGRLLTGIQVNLEGDEIAPRGYDEVRHVIEMALVQRRVAMKMDKYYGELVEATA